MMPRGRPLLFAPWLLAVALANGGCGSDGPSAPDGEAGALAARVEDEPPGANCPGGGHAIHEGRDDDGDGALDPGEIDATEYVCAEQGELPGLLTTQAEEPPGEPCPHGGTAVRSGLDLDGDGALDAAEVAETTYVCAGAPTEEPEQAPERLVRIDEEPAGPRCLVGGAAVHSGVDDDRDGALDEEEIDDTEYVCDGSFIGDYTVNDADALLALDGIRVITGRLVIRWDQATAVALDDLAYVGGSLQVVDPDALERLSLPALAHVGGDLSVTSAPLLRSMSLPSLWRVGGALRLWDIDQLAALSLPELTEIGGALDPLADALLIQMEALADLAVPSLQRSGGRIYLDTPALERIAFPALFEAGGIDVTDGSAAQALELPVLREVHGDLSLTNVAAAQIALPRLEATAGRLSVSFAPRAARLSLPALRAVGDTFGVSASAELTDLDAPLLESAPQVMIEHLPKLTSFSLPALSTVQKRVSIVYNESLTRFSLPALRRTEWLTVWDNPRLTGLDGLAQLESVSQHIMLDGNLALEDLSGLASLAFIGGNLEIMGHHAMTRVGLSKLVKARFILIGRLGDGNDRLEVVDLPLLHEVDALGIVENERLTDLALPSLASVVGALTIAWNPAMPQCEAEALAAQLTEPPAEVHLHSNDDGGTCD
ncbi:hypothetical protein WMF38_00615 [Sorangium sp. So ce118]